MAFNKLKELTTSEQAISIVMLFVQIIAGIGIGAACGLLAIPFKYIKNPVIGKYAKGVFCLAMCIAFTIAADEAKFGNARFIGALIFGYVCQRVWGSSECPNEHLYHLFFFI